MSSDHVPSYRKHKQSGQAIVTLTDRLGGRRDVLLGRFGTPESHLRYARAITEWEAATPVHFTLEKQNSAVRERLAAKTDFVGARV